MTLDFMPSPSREEPGLFIRDPYRFSDAMLIVPPALVECLQYFDGRHTALDLKAYLVRLTGQLESILGYIAKLSEVDTTGVEPMAHALPLHNVLREDVVEPSLPLEKVLQNAPETDGPFFKVPKVIGGDEDSAG